MSKERPILFNGGMVRAISEGRKTQTRRIIKNAAGSTMEDKRTSPDPVDRLVGRILAFEDPNNEGNSKKYHTGQRCVEGCGRDAGTAWSPYWCFPCNVVRIKRIRNSLASISNPPNRGDQ